ncbi:hypothetical protein JTB14_037676 [Gonioctena quinquepunctata]|nr:hypothetical protein JTB14_037676 [Gonioctena quinquepunctata]
MSEFGTEYDNYLSDPRMACQYGKKCYQKNPAHHEKYKHPPRKKGETSSKRHTNKKFKAEPKVLVTTSNSEDDTDTISSGSNEKNEVEVSNNVSDSNGSSSEEDEKNRSDENEEKRVEEETSGKRKLDSSNRESKNEGTDKVMEGQKLVKTEVSDPKRDDNKRSDNTNTSMEPGKRLQWVDFIKQKFLVTMPEDFYQFWNFCEKLKPNNVLFALRDVGLTLVGPFDVLAGKFENVFKPDSDFLIHWRYFRDPPELQTVLKGDGNSGFHIGYFRDSPEDMPVFLASNSSEKDGIMTLIGGNIFAAVHFYLEDLKKTGDPFKKMHIGRIQSALNSEIKKLKIDLSKKTDAIVQREKKIVSRTFNKIGLVVPIKRNSKTDQEKQKYLSELQPVLTYASIATDECDFGTGIELGWNLISHGVEELNLTVERTLAVNNRLLKREAFARIAEAHMKKRRKGCDLSILK